LSKSASMGGSKHLGSSKTALLYKDHIDIILKHPRNFSANAFHPLFWKKV